MSDFVRQNAADTSFDTSDSWVILTPIEQSIKRKIESVGVPLKDWDIQINYGIKTGFNDAFIISTEKRDEILANCADEAERERTAELIRPILRGRDIKRYGYDWAGLWLINTHNGIKGKLERIHIEDYPAVKAHLDQYWDKISVRADKGETPYNLRNCAYLDDFNKPKLVWGEISDRSKFAFDKSGVYVPEATTFLLVGKDALSLYAFLNSSPAEWYFSKLGPRTGEGTIRWKKYTVEQIFAPKLSEAQIDEVTAIISQPIEDIASLMNNWFYSFYELSDDEIAYINGYFNAIVKQKQDDFNKPKLVWGEISDRSKFAFDKSGVYVPEATTFLLVGKDALSLYAFLNSSPAEWYFSKLGPRTGEGTIRWKKYTVEQIFAPKLSEAQIDEVTAIISQPIEDIASLMNNWFYSFYELSDDEIAYINGYFNAIVKQKQDDFSKPKIVYREISIEMEACMAPAHWMLNNKLYMITSDTEDLDYICAFLNSKIFSKVIMSSVNFGGGKGVDFLGNVKLPRFGQCMDNNTVQSLYIAYNLTDEEIGFIES